MSIIFWKRCRRCGRPFDIGTNFNICPECRKKEEEDGEKIRAA